MKSDRARSSQDEPLASTGRSARTPLAPAGLGRPAESLRHDEPVRFERYVALGDSQTEGLNDPDGRSGFRGWADRLAVLLLATSPHLQYANLAVRGRLMAAIRARVAGYN